jgi:hypothetical protein
MSRRYTNEQLVEATGDSIRQPGDGAAQRQRRHIEEA